MNVIALKTFDFQQQKNVTNKAGNTIAVTKQQFILRPLFKEQYGSAVSPLRIPQQVPNWVRDEDLFKLAVADKSIIVVSSLPPALEYKKLTAA